MGSKHLLSDGQLLGLVRMSSGGMFGGHSEGWGLSRQALGKVTQGLQCPRSLAPTLVVGHSLTVRVSEDKESRR